MHRSASRAARAAGLLPLSLFALTALEHLRIGQLYELLWMCNIANLLVGIGLLAQRSSVALIGTYWIAYGSAWWLYDGLAYGGITLLSSLKHAGTTSIGIAAALLAGDPLLDRARPRVFWLSTLAFCALQAICRAFTSELANVNFAFESYHLVGRWFPKGSYAPFWCALVGTGAFVAYLLERALIALRALTRPPSSRALRAAGAAFAGVTTTPCVEQRGERL